MGFASHVHLRSKFACSKGRCTDWLQVFGDDLTGPEEVAIEINTLVNGSYDPLSGNFTLRYGAKTTTWPLPFNATADEVEIALEVRACTALRSDRLETLIDTAGFTWYLLNAVRVGRIPRCHSSLAKTIFWHLPKSRGLPHCSGIFRAYPSCAQV